MQKPKLGHCLKLVNLVVSFRQFVELLLLVHIVTCYIHNGHIHIEVRYYKKKLIKTTFTTTAHASHEKMTTMQSLAYFFIPINKQPKYSLVTTYNEIWRFEH